MTHWQAIIPLKPEGQRKTRLSPRLTAAERNRLSERLFRRVTEAVAAVPRVETIWVLSRCAPQIGALRWIEEHGAGLNRELQNARTFLGCRPVLVLPADLAAPDPSDLHRLLEAAEIAGCAIVPDRHGRGTNALALHDKGAFEFQFGPGSFSRHCLQRPGRIRCLRAESLELDIDTPEDIDLARPVLESGEYSTHRSRMVPKDARGSKDEEPTTQCRDYG